MTLSDDMLRGAKAIAKETGLPVQTVYRLSDKGELPTFRIGRTLAARRSELQAAFTSRQSAA